jgi:hypothetical protein
MLQSIGDVREGFICPECRQDMSTIEMLQVHFEDVHMKPSASTVKGIYSIDFLLLIEHFRFIFIRKTKNQKCSR